MPSNPYMVIYYLIYIYIHTHTHRVVCHQIHTWSFIIIIYNTVGLYAIKSSQSFIIIYNTIGLYAIKSTHYLWLHLTVAFVFFGGIKPYGINMYVFRCMETTWRPMGFVFFDGIHFLKSYGINIIIMFKKLHPAVAFVFFDGINPMALILCMSVCASRS